MKEGKAAVLCKISCSLLVEVERTSYWCLRCNSL